MQDGEYVKWGAMRTQWCNVADMVRFFKYSTVKWKCAARGAGAI